jgi:hypothetical protein
MPKWDEDPSSTEPTPRTIGGVIHPHSLTELEQLQRAYTSAEHGFAGAIARATLDSKLHPTMQRHKERAIMDAAYELIGKTLDLTAHARSILRQRAGL